MRFILPLVLFLGVGVFLYRGLDRDPRYVPSPLIGKPAPEFSLPVLASSNGLADSTGTGESSFSPSQMAGKVWLFNIWGTWCAGCRDEHPVLVSLARQGTVEIVGLNYKDESDSAVRWLDELGDPYFVTAVDNDGRIGIDWGFYGAPETFVIDQSGIVRYKHIGPVTADDLNKSILPLISQLRASSG